jgi:hypothetical protein
MAQVLRSADGPLVVPAAGGSGRVAAHGRLNASLWRGFLIAV